jgi:putative transposase
MAEYYLGSHSKYLLQMHLILVCKYRKKLLVRFGSEVKNLCYDLSKRHNFIIKTMEVDKDHIHLLIDFKPKISIKEIVRKLKSHTTVMLWKQYSVELKKDFWVEHTFWSDGYFVCTIGNANEETIRRYVDEQG